jgi:hypothetical protein
MGGLIMIVDGFALLRQELGRVVHAFERGMGLGLGVVERLLLLCLPTICDELGCVRLDLRMIRVAIFPETGISLARIWLALKRIEKRKLVSIFWTNDKIGLVCLEYLKDMMQDRLDSLPDTPLPPWIDIVKLGDGSFKVARTDK